MVEIMPLELFGKGWGLRSYCQYVSVTVSADYIKILDIIWNYTQNWLQNMEL